MDGPGVSGA